MPILNLKTNVKVDDVRAFIAELSNFSAETLGKPEAIVSVAYTHDPDLALSGSFESAFTLALTSTDLGPAVNDTYSAAYFDFFQKKLGVDISRGCIMFFDLEKSYIGLRGTTVATLLGSK